MSEDTLILRGINFEHLTVELNDEHLAMEVDESDYLARMTLSPEAARALRDWLMEKFP